MSTVNVFQISLEIWGCLLCVLIATISGDKAYKEGSVIARIWMLLLLNGFVLISDAFAYIFRGDISTFGIYMTRISNFIVFFLEGIMTWNVAVCVQNLVQGEKKVLENRWMRVCGVLTLVQLIGTVITPFTNFYYYFDATNHYHRGTGVVLSFAALGTVCLISGVKLFRHGKEVPTGILHVFRTAIPVFGLCFLVQFLEYGISLINVGLTLLLLMLYLGLWKDSMRKENERQIEELEAIMKELMAAREYEGQ